MKMISLVSKKVLFIVGLIGALLFYQNCGGPLVYQEQAPLGEAQQPSTVATLPVKIPLKADCTTMAEAYSSDSSVSKLNWHANKGTAAAPILVEGTWGFDSILYKGMTGTSYTVKLRFDMASLNSGVDLRNQRIRDIVFGSATGYQLEYTATLTAAQMSPVAALAVGRSTNLTLAGKINILGKEVNLNIPVTITKAATGFEVKSNNFTVNLISVLGLQPQITELSSLCNAVAQDAVPVDFTFTIAKSCPQ